jgi:elongation factor P
VERKDLEYLYNDGDLYYFMDTESYEQIPLNKDVLGDSFRFIKENTLVKILSFKETYSASNPPTSLSWKLLRPTRALRATPPPT